MVRLELVTYFQKPSNVSSVILLTPGLMRIIHYCSYAVQKSTDCRVGADLEGDKVGVR